MSAEIVAILRIDQDRCEGHGRCYALFPDLFESDDIGVGTVRHRDLAAGDLADAERAVAVCPEQAVVFESTTQ